MTVATATYAHTEVASDTLWSHTLWENDYTPLHLEADEYLGRAFAILASNFHDLGVVQEGRVSWLGPGSVRRAQWAVSLKYNVMHLAVGNECLLGEVGVTLALHHSWLHAALAAYLYRKSEKWWRNSLVSWPQGVPSQRDHTSLICWLLKFERPMCRVSPASTSSSMASQVSRKWVSP